MAYSAVSFLCLKVGKMEDVSPMPGQSSALPSISKYCVLMQKVFNMVQFLQRERKPS